MDSRVGVIGSRVGSYRVSSNRAGSSRVASYRVGSYRVSRVIDGSISSNAASVSVPPMFSRS